MAERINYFSPLVWCHIENAAKKAGKPWVATDIVCIAKQANPELFKKLSPQVVRRWIDAEAKKNGIYQWTEKVGENLRKGNAPGGHSTRGGILVSGMQSNNKKTHKVVGWISRNHQRYQDEAHGNT